MYMYIHSVHAYMYIYTCAASRNSLGCDYIFIHKCNKLYSFAHVLYEGDHTHSDMDIEVRYTHVHVHVSFCLCLSSLYY